MSFTTRGPRGQHLRSAQRTVQVAQATGRPHLFADVAAALAGLGLGVSLALELQNTGLSTLTHLGDAMTLLGRVTGMVGTYGLVMTLFLVARIPIIEREVGMDRTLRWHRKLAPWSLLLIALHVIFIVFGYSINDNSNFLHELWSQITTLRWILPATAGLLLLLAAGFTSYRLIRTRMSYETWWVIHLYTYIAVVLSYTHQVTLGNAFIGHPLAAKLWLALTVSSVASLVVFRWALPIVRGWRYDLRVYAVVPEGPDVISVWMTGRNLRRMRANGGQFFCWRFLTPELWWHAHPYSLSAPPDGHYLRITVKDLGDHSAALASIAPGTRVLAEGPYGAFTAARRHGDRVVLVAGGVGITPIRAVLEELPNHAVVDVLYRARTDDEVVLRRELDTLAQRPNTRVRYLVGSRREHPMDPRTLVRLVPHIAHSDIYICGPEPLTHAVRSAVEILGVPASHIHDEAFAF